MHHLQIDCVISNTKITLLGFPLNGETKSYMASSKINMPKNETNSYSRKLDQI
jgi:hypothetical protein